MTGEIDLLGKVMPVGGIKEKTMAARRSNVTCLVFPKGNKRDFDELPDHLKAGLDVHFAETYDDVVRSRSSAAPAPAFGSFAFAQLSHPLSPVFLSPIPPAPLQFKVIFPPE